MAADRGGAYVAVPPAVVDALGGRGRTPVVATFDGVEYRGSVVAMGSGMVVGVLKRIRARLGKEPGDTVAVTLVVDDEPRRVDVPDDLRAALGEANVLVTLRRALVLAPPRVRAVDRGGEASRDASASHRADRRAGRSERRILT